MSNGTSDAIQRINALEKRIVHAEDDADNMLWEQAGFVVQQLETLSERALAAQWINVRTGKPYARNHVWVVKQVYGHLNGQNPRPRFRETYNAIMNARPPKPPAEPEPFHWINAVNDLGKLVGKIVRVWPEPTRYYALSLLRDAAHRRDAFRRYAARSDAWGRGLTKDPILVGLVGEYANDLLLRRRGLPCGIDLDLRPHGDGGRDFCVNGLVGQVKTRRKDLSQRSLVKRGDRGHILPLQCDVFVFAQWSEADPGSAWLLGWIWAERARLESFERSRVAPHWNLTIRDHSLLPMSRLVDELHGRSVCA